MGYNDCGLPHEVTMDIEYRTSVPSIENYYALFETTGWNRDYTVTPEELARALAGSQYHVTAYDGERLVGSGRLITDGVLHAMLYDMIVHPDYQGRGIGSTILGMLVQWCTMAGIRDIQLFCSRGKSAFYGKAGFNPRPPNAPGMSYAKQMTVSRARNKVLDRSR